MRRHVGYLGNAFVTYKERRTEYERVVIVNKQYWDRNILQIQHLKT